MGIFTSLSEEQVEDRKRIGRLKLIERLSKNGSFKTKELFDAGGDVILANRDDETIPFEFKCVNGSFDCSNNKLKSLINSPVYVGKDFKCSENFLESLEGCPRYVEGDFLCEKMHNGKVLQEDEIRNVCQVKGKVIC